MIKMTMLLKRHPKLTHAEFVEHHLHRHGPLFRSVPEAEKHVVRYLQTHPVADVPDAVSVNDFDGTAELWFDSVAGMEAVLTSKTYKERVFPDEKTFLDHAHTLITVGMAQDVIGAAGAA